MCGRICLALVCFNASTWRAIVGKGLLLFLSLPFRFPFAIFCGRDWGIGMDHAAGRTWIEIPPDNGMWGHKLQILANNVIVSDIWWLSMLDQRHGVALSSAPSMLVSKHITRLSGLSLCFPIPLSHPLCLQYPAFLSISYFWSCMFLPTTVDWDLGTFQLPPVSFQNGHPLPLWVLFSLLLR